MKIGFFGGGFNPISNVHINIAENLVIDNYIDKVMFVPVGDLYNKKGLIEAKHRYNMIKLAIEGNKYLEVEDIEIKLNKNFYASEIFKLLTQKYSNDDVYFIMGTDNFLKMPTWKEYEYIKDRYNYIIISRDYKGNINIPNVIFVDRNKTREVDSTIIRNKISKNDDVSEYLSKKVYNYIKENKLYLN